MKLLRPLSGYTLYDHKTNDYICHELQITGILDKIDEYRQTGFNTCKECHKTESLWNHTTTDHKEGEQLEDQRNVGESSCNFGDGMDQRVQSLMFMMMVMKLASLTDFMSYCIICTICCVGLDTQIQEIKESVELPLTHPEYYEEMGIKPPKGVILYGPPGTGKTLLAKAVANQTSATFLRVVGSELIQKYLVSLCV